MYCVCVRVWLSVYCVFFDVGREPEHAFILTETHRALCIYLCLAVEKHMESSTHWRQQSGEKVTATAAADIAKYKHGIDNVECNENEPTRKWYYAMINCRPTRRMWERERGGRWGQARWTAGSLAGTLNGYTHFMLCIGLRFIGRHNISNVWMWQNGHQYRRSNGFQLSCFWCERDAVFRRIQQIFLLLFETAVADVFEQQNK